MCLDGLLAAARAPEGDAEVLRRDRLTVPVAEIPLLPHREPVGVDGLVEPAQRAQGDPEVVPRRGEAFTLPQFLEDRTGGGVRLQGLLQAPGLAERAPQVVPGGGLACPVTDRTEHRAGPGQGDDRLLAPAELEPGAAEVVPRRRLDLRVLDRLGQLPGALVGLDRLVEPAGFRQGDAQHVPDLPLPEPVTALPVDPAGAGVRRDSLVEPAVVAQGETQVAPRPARAGAVAQRERRLGRAPVDGHPVVEVSPSVEIPVKAQCQSQSGPGVHRVGRPQGAGDETGALAVEPAQRLLPAVESGRGGPAGEVAHVPVGRLGPPLVVREQPGPRRRALRAQRLLSRHPVQGVGADQVVHAPAAPHTAGADQVGAHQDVQLPPRRGGRAGQHGERLVARLLPRCERQEAEEACGFRAEAAVRQVEGGPHTPLAVVQVVEDGGGVGQLSHQFRHGLARIGEEQRGRDLQRQRQMPAQLAQFLGPVGIVQDARVRRVGGAQGRAQDVPGHLGPEDVEVEQVRAELWHGVARGDQDPVRGVPGQQRSDLPGVRGVVHHDQHAAACAGPFGEHRAVESGTLVHRARYVRGGHSQGAQQGFQELLGSRGRLVVAVAVDEQGAGREPAAFACRVGGPYGQRGLAHAAQPGHRGDRGRGAVCALGGQRREQRVQFVLASGELGCRGRERVLYVGHGSVMVVMLHLLPDRLAPERALAEVDSIPAVRVPAHPAHPARGRAPKVDLESLYDSALTKFRFTTSI